MKDKQNESLPLEYTTDRNERLYNPQEVIVKKVCLSPSLLERIQRKLYHHGKVDKTSIEKLQTFDHDTAPPIRRTRLAECIFNERSECSRFTRPLSHGVAVLTSQRPRCVSR